MTLDLSLLPDGGVRWQSNWAPLKKGVADVPAIFDALAAVDYAGWVTFEDFTNEQPRRDRLRADLAYVTGLDTIARQS